MTVEQKREWLATVAPGHTVSVYCGTFDDVTKAVEVNAVQQGYICTNDGKFYDVKTGVERGGHDYLTVHTMRDYDRLLSRELTTRLNRIPTWGMYPFALVRKVALLIDEHDTEVKRLAGEAPRR